MIPNLVMKRLHSEKNSPTLSVPYSKLVEAVKIIESFLVQKKHLDADNLQHKEAIVLYTLLGGSYAHPFGNIYAISGYPHKDSVISMNHQKGRPNLQIASITTIPIHFKDLFKISLLPKEISSGVFSNLLEALIKEIGVFGIRGPASERIHRLYPHFISKDESLVPNVQLIAVGKENELHHELIMLHKKYSNGEYMQSITSANLSSSLSGNYEAAHYRLNGLVEDLGGIFPIIAYPKDSHVTKPHHKKWSHLIPVSTSIISIHYISHTTDKHPALVLEREGSASFELLEKIVQRTTNNTLRLVRGNKAKTRLQQKIY